MLLQKKLYTINIEIGIPKIENLIFKFSILLDSDVFILWYKLSILNANFFSLKSISLELKKDFQSKKIENKN